MVSPDYSLGGDASVDHGGQWALPSKPPAIDGKIYVPIGRLDQFMGSVSSTATIGTLVDRSNFAAFVSPVQQCLPLLRRKKKIAQRIVLSDLSGAPSTRLPALDQTPIFLEHPPRQEVSSILGCSARSPCAI
jgi:hypothetical protein